MGVKFFFFPAPKDDHAGMPSIKPPAPVRVMVVQRDTMLEEIYVNGNLMGSESINLQPEAEGKVLEVFFNEGEEVAKGKLLLKLNDAELKASLQKIIAQITLATEKVQRLQKLVSANSISKEEYENSLNTLQILEADKAFTQAMIDKTELRAPFSGTIGLRNVSPGSMINRNTVIASLEQSDTMKLDISVPEKYAYSLRKGSIISFHVDHLKEEFTGRIYAIDPRIDKASRSLRLRAICSNHQQKLKSGAFARVRLVLNEKSDALMLPTEAIIPDVKGSKVFLVRNGSGFPEMVQLGLRSSSRVEVTEGLQAGDSVIISGHMQLKPGQVLRVIP